MAAIVPNSEVVVAASTASTDIMAKIYAGLNGNAHFVVDVENGTNPGEDGILYHHFDSVTYPQNYVILRNGNVIEYSMDNLGGLTLSGGNVVGGGSGEHTVAETLIKDVTTIASLGTTIHLRYTPDVFHFQIMNNTDQFQSWIFDIGVNWIWGTNMTGYAQERMGCFCGIARYATAAGTDFILSNSSNSRIHLGGSDFTYPLLDVLIPALRIWTTKQPGIKPSHLRIAAESIAGSFDSPVGFMKYFITTDENFRNAKYIVPSTSTNQGWMRITYNTGTDKVSVLWDRTVGI